MEMRTIVEMTTVVSINGSTIRMTIQRNKGDFSPCDKERCFWILLACPGAMSAETLLLVSCRFGPACTMFANSLFEEIENSSSFVSSKGIISLLKIELRAAFVGWWSEGVSELITSFTSAGLRRLGSLLSKPLS